MRFFFFGWIKEKKKELFTPSKFDVKNLKNNKKILHSSKLYDTNYRQCLKQKIEKEKQEREREQEEKQVQKQKEQKKAKSKKMKEKKEKKIEAEEFGGKIKEKTKKSRIKREKENNKNDKYIFRHKMRSKKRP